MAGLVMHNAILLCALDVVAKDLPATYLACCVALGASLAESLTSFGDAVRHPYHVRT